MKNHQLQLLKKENKSYGGELLKTRAGRSTPRPIDTKKTMHLVLRSSKARGSLSFKHRGNEIKIKTILDKFSKKYGVQILSLANVGNHLHFHIKINSRQTYKPFIRAITSAIATSIQGSKRWNKNIIGRFWDYRPFTRVVVGFRAFLNLKDYIQINQLEGLGVGKTTARFILAHEKDRAFSSA